MQLLLMPVAVTAEKQKVQEGTPHYQQRRLQWKSCAVPVLPRLPLRLPGRSHTPLLPPF